MLRFQRILILYKYECQINKRISSVYQILLHFQLKKLKFDLQKAVNIPVNAISAVSGAHLRDKLQRLLVLLSGQQVEITNRRVSVSEHPAALTFCKYLIAKMIVVSAGFIVKWKISCNHRQYACYIYMYMTGLVNLIKKKCCQFRSTVQTNVQILKIFLHCFIFLYSACL